MPGLDEIGRAWRDGEVPLLSRFSWCAGGLAGEYQYGSFNPIIQFMATATSFVPSMATRAALLVAFFGWLTFWGSLRLGADFEMPPAIALAFAGVFCLNRYSLDIGWREWLPMGISLTMFPWFWHSLANRRLSVPLLILSLTFILTSGWPFVVVASASLGVFYFLLALYRRQSRRAGMLVACGLCALALSSLSLGLLLEYSQSATRSQRANWDYRLGALDGLTYFIPGLSFYSGALQLDNFYTCIGWIPCLGLLGGLLERKKPSSLAWLAVAWFLLAICPSLGGMRFSSRWLHYLNPLMGLLGLSWLAGKALDEKHRFGRATFAAILIGQLLGPGLDYLGGHPHRWQPGPPLLLLGFCWAWNRRLAGRDKLLAGAVWLGLLVAMPLTPLSWHQFPAATPPSASLVTPQRCWMALYSWQELQDPRASLVVPLRYGNLCLSERIPMVNGYSPLFAAPIIRAWNFSNAGSLDPNERQVANVVLGSASGGLMEKLQITGLLLSPQWQPLGSHLAANGWRLLGNEGLVQCWIRDQPVRPLFESLRQVRACRWGQPTAEASLIPGGPAVIRSATWTEGLHSLAPVVCRQESSDRNSARVQVTANASTQKTLVALHRPWFQGYRAFLNGQEMPLHTLNLQNMAVELPPGSPAGILEVVYRPHSFKIGGILSLIGLAGLLVLSWWNQLMTGIIVRGRSRGLR